MRMAATAVTGGGGLMLLRRTGIARAEGGAGLTQVVPMSGTVTKGGKAFKGKQFKGTYAIERFVNSRGKLYTVGTLKGKAAGKKIDKDNVRLPAAVANNPAASGSQAHASQVP